jgi:hypothetical protein
MPTLFWILPFKVEDEGGTLLTTGAESRGYIPQVWGANFRIFERNANGA